MSGTRPHASKSSSYLSSGTILWIFTGLTLLNILYLWWYYWPGSLPDGVTSGVWLGLAMDQAQGVFYRPLISEAGYGGTRYMPLFWMLHGFGIRWFGHPLETGLVLFLASILLMHAGLYGVLRQCRVPVRLAIPFCLMFAASLSYQMISLSIRGDFLACALILWGLFGACKFQEHGERHWCGFALLCFAGAFATKFTALYAPLAVVVFYFLRGQTTRAFQWAGGMGLLSALVVLLIHVASEGRAWESFQAVGTGGMALEDAGRFLIRFGSELVRDPFFCAAFLIALFYFLKKWRSSQDDLVFVFFGVTLAATLFIYTSPGTATNHLIDLHAATALILARAWQEGGIRRILSLVLLPMCFYLMASWYPSVPSVPAFFQQHRKPAVETVRWFQQRYGKDARPVLSRFTYFDVLQGRRPYILDRFNLDLMARNHPAVRADFENKIRNQFFGSVIESNWPGLFQRDFDQPEGPGFQKMAERFHRHYDQDDPFHSLIRRHYEITAVKRPFVFLSPRSQLDKG